MSAEWRVLRAGEVDHEALWVAVLMTGAIVGAAWITVLGLPPIGCQLKSLTGVPCPTCGFGRAALALWHGQVAAAFRWNPAAPVGALAASAYFAYAMTALATGRRLRVTVRAAEARLLRWASVGSIAAVWFWLLADGR
jgi:hypothetical protein